MKKILILGASIYQVPLIQTAKRLGMYTIVASIPGEYPGFALADQPCYVNTTDEQEILRVARTCGIDGICTTGTDVAVSTIGYVCDRMGLPGVSQAAALLATDKARMKDAFQAGGVSASAYRRAYTLEQVYGAAEEIGFPVVVKRVDSSGSRGITLVRRREGLEAAFRNALHGSRRDYVLVEECLTGTEIGVDGLVQNGKLVFLAPHDKFVYNSGKITIPVGHCFPYGGTEAARREIAVQMQRAVTALGLDNCSVNADVFVDGDRVSVIEMGGRTGATCIPELISMYYGFDFYRTILQTAMGEMLTYHTQGSGRPCMAKLLMSPRDGVITRLNREKLAALEGEGAVVKLDYPEGHGVEAMINGTTRIGHLIARADSETEFDRLLNQVYACIEVDGVSLERLWNE